MAAEIPLVQNCHVSSEQTLEIPIPRSDASGGVLLTLRGKADRLDRDPQGLYRIVDYKFSMVTSYRALVKHNQEGQLAAYAAGIAARGEVVGGAHYRALLDSDAAGYQGPLSPDKLGTSPPQVAQLPARLLLISQAIEALAAGAAHTDPEQGLCEARGYAPIARLDEARLQSADAAEDEE
jgi:RecB family exonuclease